MVSVPGTVFDYLLGKAIEEKAFVAGNIAPVLAILLWAYLEHTPFIAGIKSFAGGLIQRGDVEQEAVARYLATVAAGSLGGREHFKRRQAIAGRCGSLLCAAAVPSR